jgi:hypothetical protein
VVLEEADKPIVINLHSSLGQDPQAFLVDPFDLGIIEDRHGDSLTADERR